ncbi:gasdermin-E [Phascolarctos cinereus]|uniref:Non-syndromic hearing impairment protein 5 n=1 Tax=Phascolarctos cinereus TaxID=38626 RepID=A0A6P5KTF3_PHACI|nr:non-syndromic hearing impairment protein 5 [Phascolarctos cinereus]XP_020849086.1 non-syndromic hearing impairment protein 5 [Phascolarctos cinereus]XP_020849087.1 non-syndromic hearing impairment protein 5 [Phascolarctos cinereus]XP_020849088.1 non-syndromic hearing impairment protein 5 [Phascolarctos cinereus]XP_020849089.1 non-syndromic hearing impairment protein 5 [Phascolarctos cinereus]XP_020849090.1 non-syndromic hearing impairment protein 5 [Phascolarctos cinereus]
MFAKATRNFLKDTDPGGDLIPVKSLNDSDTLQLMSLVVKKKKFWCWQRPKYQFLSATINDILTKDQFVNPVVVESDFVKYEGKFEDVVKGTVETVLGRITLNAGGAGLVESQSSFGTLRKQEVDLQQLIREAVDRTINLKSPLLQQVLERKKEVLCILTQKIMTTQKCVISEHVQIEEKCGGVVGLKTKRVQVSVSEDGNVKRDSNVVLEIPASTSIAYRVLELYVKKDGQFEFCLLQEKQGGFERESTDGPDHLDAGIFGEFLFLFTPDAVDGNSEAAKLVPAEGPLSSLKDGLLLLERNFRPFVELSGHHQAALCEILWEILFNDELVVALDTMLDDLFTGGSPQLTTLTELSHVQQQQLATFLGLAGLQVQKDLLVRQDTRSNQELLSTIYFFISALAEMPDNTPALMGICCKLHMVPALCHLPQVTSADGFSELGDPSLAPLNDAERFEIVQKLFALSNITLERGEAAVKAVIMKKPQYLPLLLYIILNGLCALERKDE